MTRSRTVRWFLPVVLAMSTLMPACGDEDDRRIGRLGLEGYSRYLAVSGDMAFVGGARNNKLSLVDVSNPSRPSLRSSLQFDSVGASMAADDRLVYAGNFHSLRILDVSNPEHPLQISEIQITSGSASGAVVVNGRAYLAEVQGGLRVFDVTDAAAPAFLGELRGGESYFGLAVAGTLAYIAAGRSLHIVDVTDPANLAIVGEVSLPQQATAYDVAVAGNKAYVAALGTGLYVIDVADPESPRVMGHVPSIPGVRANSVDVAVGNDRVYLADAGGGLRIIDASEAANPVVVATIPVYGEALQVQLVGTQAFVAAGDGGLQIYDVSGL